MKFSIRVKLVVVLSALILGLAALFYLVPWTVSTATANSTRIDIRTVDADGPGYTIADNISIQGGTITSIGGSGGAGIGGATGIGGGGNGGSSGNITITGDANVTATGGNGNTSRPNVLSSVASGGGAGVGSGGAILNVRAGAFENVVINNTGERNFKGGAGVSGLNGSDFFS